MGNVLDEIKVEGRVEGEAKGWAKGRAEGIIVTIRDLVASGVLSIDAARNEINKLVAQGMIPEALAREAMHRLG